MEGVFFNSKGNDRVYDYEDWCRYFVQFISNGVYADPVTSMQVQAISDLNVRIAPGVAFINGHHAYADGSDELEINYGNAEERTDIVLLRLDLAERRIYPVVAENQTVENAIIRDGTFYDLALAEITVKANAYSITQADIKDLRPYEQVCGFATGMIRQIGTADLFAQYQAAWDDFVAQLGESDNVSINTKDVETSRQVTQIREQLPFGAMFMTV